MSLLFCYAIKLTQVKFPQNLSAPPQGKDRKRKRAQEPEESSVCAPTERLRKRPRTSVARSAFRDTFSPLAADGVADNKVNPIAYWIQEKRWPKDCFDQDDQTREDFRKDFEKDSWLEKYWEPENNLNHLPARKKSSSFLRSNQSETSFATTSCTTPSGRKSRAANDDPIKIRVMKLSSRPKAASWTNPNWASQMQAEAFAKPYLRRSRRCLKNHCFVMTYSVKLAKIYVTETRPESFKILLD